MSLERPKLSSLKRFICPGTDSEKAVQNGDSPEASAVRGVVGVSHYDIPSACTEGASQRLFCESGGPNNSVSGSPYL